MIGNDQQQQHDNRHRRGDRPVAVVKELLPQHAANHDAVRPAQQFRDHELADRRDKHQHGAGDNAAFGERDDHRKKVFSGRAPRSSEASTSE